MSLRRVSPSIFIPVVAASALLACGKSTPPPEPAPQAAAPAVPVAAEPAGTEPATPSPATAEPVAAEPAGTEPATPSPATAAEPAPDGDAPTPIPARAPSPERAAKRAADDPRKGSFSLDWRAPRSKKLRAVADALKESEIFPELIGSLNETFLLPTDVAIGFEHCDEVNAFYDLEDKRISLCWELIEDSIGNFERDSDDAEEAIAGALNATLFTFFHELGHALVDVLDLPITGREEDAVDQLATWILLAEGSDDGALMALDGAASFRHDAENEAEDGDEPITWGEHGLNEQRFYNILCWVYGHAPDKLGAILESNDGPLPDDRAERCEDEYKRLDTAWTKLLEPHVVPD